MSKKNKKSKKLHVSQSFAAATGVDFEPLRPTESGKKKLAAIGARMSKKSIEAGLAIEPVEEQKVFDLTPMSEMLDTMEDLVKAGKYGKALAAMDVSVRDSFLEAFESRESFKDENGQAMMGMVRKFLTIGKSFYEYDEKGREIIDNITYDGLMARFLRLGGKEPTGITPKGSKKLEKVKIKYPKLHNNMDKVYRVFDHDPVPEGVKESESVEAWLRRLYSDMKYSPDQRISIEISDKIDGVSINGTIKEGDNLLHDPQTRGDESESVAVRGLDKLQLEVGHVANATFGGQFEAFCTKEDAAKVSEYLGRATPYKSPRHAIAGVIHQLSTNEDDGILQFISLYPIATEGLDGTYTKRTDYLSNFGIVPKDMRSRKIIKGSFRQLLSVIAQDFKESNDVRNSLSYPIDGRVLTVVVDEIQSTIGRDGRTNKFQVALKFDPASAVAVVDGITLDCGKKGTRTIQVMFKEPVTLDGVSYDHVPVLSRDLFIQMRLRRGSRVNVHRVGDVIPAITVVGEGSGPMITVPAVCPICGGRLDVKDKKFYDPNPNCPGNLIGRFTQFFDKMGLTDYAESFANDLINKAKVKNLADMIHLTQEKLTECELSGKKAQAFPELLHQAISEHYDYEVIGAFGYPDVGAQKAKVLLNHIDLLDPNYLRDRDNYLSIYSAANEAVGPNRAMGLVDAIMSKDAIRDLEALIPLITKKFKDLGEIVRIGHSGADLDNELKQLCREKGYEVVDGKSFDILVVPNLDHRSKKVSIAENKNLPIMTPEMFRDRYGRKSA